MRHCTLDTLNYQTCCKLKGFLRPTWVVECFNVQQPNKITKCFRKSFWENRLNVLVRSKAWNFLLICSQDSAEGGFFPWLWNKNVSWVGQWTNNPPMFDCVWNRAWFARASADGENELAIIFHQPRSLMLPSSQSEVKYNSNTQCCFPVSLQLSLILGCHND